MKTSNDIIKEQDYAINLHDLLQNEEEIHFIFRTGFIKEIRMKGHQFPFKEDFIKRHKFALESIDMMYVKEDSIIYAMVRVRYISPVDRAEYIIKRALLDLVELHGWEKIQ